MSHPISRPRTHAPLPIKRQLRQEAGFGCCVCGCPIIQYHHIIEWSEDHHFRPDDMMVLCPLHHDQATKGAMPEIEQREFKKNPLNVRNNRVRGRLAIKQDYCAADMGSITIVGSGTFLKMSGEEIIGLTLGPDKNIELSIKLYSKNDELLAEINNNEWISGDPLPWDIESDWQTLKLRERTRNISISIDARTVPMRIQADLWRKGENFKADKIGIFINSRSSVSLQNMALVGCTIDVDRTKDILSIGQQTGISGLIINWPNKRERLWKAKEAWNKLVQNEQI